jgi:predicted NBD/HSP70 family sugar kinase
MALRIGIDLGGTKIEGIALDASGREVVRKRVPTPREDYAATLAAVTGLVAEIEATLKEKASVGIGMPGAVARHGAREELELDVPERAAVQGGRGEGARPGGED